MWKRFDRLSKAGLFEAFFDALAAMSPSAHIIWMFDSTIMCAHISAAGAKRGQDSQALGGSRGGFTTKIHAKADGSGTMIVFVLSGGQKSDSPHFETLRELGPDFTPRAAIGDKSYASKANREAARRRNIVPVIPCKANENDKPKFFPKALHAARARIDQHFGRFKRFKRVA